MSAIAKPSSWISPEDYLEGEKSSEIRHEYIQGGVYAMADANDDHNRITGNIFAQLHQSLRGKRCEPFMTDMRARIPPAFAEAYYYPDVLVACDPGDNAKYFRERPSVIFEVISPDTERTDRREKAFAYRQIPSITTYVIVEQDQLAITVLRRAEPGWSSENLEGRNAVLRLPEIGVEITLERIYERTAAAKPPASVI
jgi:Uma2 family endonuclease